MDTCPICNISSNLISERYNNVVCNDCLVSNIKYDIEGNIVDFITDDFGFGLIAKYYNDVNITLKTNDINECYINNIKCKVETSRFGTIIFYKSL